MSTNHVLHNICSRYVTDHAARAVFIHDLSLQIHSLSHTNNRITFLKKCRNQGLIPTSFGNSRARLLTQINELVSQHREDNALLERTFSEYAFTDTDRDKFVAEAERAGEVERIAQEARLDHRFSKLGQIHRAKKLSKEKSYTFRYPCYNFTEYAIPPDILEFMQSYQPQSNVFGFKPDPLKAMSEVDSLAAEITSLYDAEGASIHDEQRVWRDLRKSTHNFSDSAQREYSAKEHSNVRTMARKLRTFCETRDLLTLSPDKGKGWVIVKKEKVTARLQEFIDQNFDEVTIKQAASDDQYLNYREGRVRRALTRLRDTPGSKEPQKDDHPMSDREYKDANSQASRLSEHIPLAKIHKFGWLKEEHGDGTPLASHLEDIFENPSEILSQDSLGSELKYRFVNPLKSSPSAGLGKLIDTILKPIQNSGLRTESIPEYAKKIQSDILENPPKPDEEYTSWDVKSFYDRLDADFFIKCLGLLWADFQEKSMRNINFQALCHAIRVCYEDGVKFNDKIFKMRAGAPTGHAISSCGQNIVMSAFEKSKVQGLIDNGILQLYDRWVDDTFVKNKIADRDHISSTFHSFDKNLEFTVETAKEVHEKGRTLKFIPVLDVGVLWAPEGGFGFTRVYRKPTTSEIVMPWNDFGPTDWKTGTLIGFIRRAYTHSSDYGVMHEEIQRITQQFRNVGYPPKLIQDKINNTLGRLLYRANPDHYPNPDAHRKDPTDLPPKWSVLFLPWSGKSAGAIVNKIRRFLPREQSRISIAYTTTRLRDLLPRYSSCTPPENKILFSSDVVYKYTCPCGQVYIGETKRRLAVRIVEHSKPKTPLMQHIKSCDGSDFSPTNFSIVARGLRGRESRKRYESIWIRYYDRRGQAFNVCESSRELQIF